MDMEAQRMSQGEGSEECDETWVKESIFFRPYPILHNWQNVAVSPHRPSHGMPVFPHKTLLKELYISLLYPPKSDFRIHQKKKTTSS
jgi:hypothetical protein